QPAAPLPHAPSPRACWRSSEPAGTHARSHLVPSAAALLPPVRCEKSKPASSSPMMVCSPRSLYHIWRSPEASIRPSRFDERSEYGFGIRQRDAADEVHDWMIGAVGGHGALPGGDAFRTILAQ